MMSTNSFNPLASWNFTLAREKIEHRAIDMDGFIETYFKIINNLHCLPDSPNLSIDVIIKGLDNKIDSWKQNVTIEYIDENVKFYYNKVKLKRSISKVSYEKNR